MLRNALLTFLILVMGKCYAQENYFVLIQADNSQPFYVKLGDRSFSSTIKGRLTLSQLKGGAYKITIGFPKQQFPEQQYTFNIEKDLEFQLKDQGEKGWGLFNPQTMELRMADKKEAPPAGVHSEGIKKDDAFSRLMAGVVGDTAVMYNTYALEKILNDTASSVAVKADSPVAARAASSPKSSAVDSASATLVPPVTSPGNVSPPPTVRPGGTIVKLSERKTPKGLRIAFADRPSGRKADTIIVIIPLDSPVSAMAVSKPDSIPVSPALARKAAPNKPDSAQTTSTEPLFRNKPDSARAPAEVVRHKPDTIATAASTDSIVRTDPNTIHVYINGAKKAPRKEADSVAALPPGNMALKADSTHAATAKATHNKSDSTPNPSAPNRELYRPRPDSAEKGASSKPVVVNSDCRNFATDYDVDRLRVKMLEISKDEDKVLTARKIFKIKCFTTRQVKALSEVFATDAGKYRFFETAYPFVSDDRFRELTDLLKDPVYNAKFKAMTGQR
ncbi:hypothetical protein Q4E93_03630 [Flavitalea sp. BT771]|uniref:hypothetical protein n=1 Tax=Flavitalea sp. BT771 TaxID=3063329 RepID=UPI0026E310C1|nr:hypothetical protein [Flavitalea sp. BT771]MDO6429666.1 hypothetical protein [Flavitalea sp. BT771]MDV6218206.1 hypothetical protein [Flavitalea sp. BT771]